MLKSEHWGWGRAVQPQRAEGQGRLVVLLSGAYRLWDTEVTPPRHGFSQKPISEWLTERKK